MKANWKIIGGIIAGVLSGLVIATIWASPREPRTVAVVGECLGTAAKDRTAINLRIRNLDKNAGVSLHRANDLALDAIDAVKKIAGDLNDETMQMQTTQTDSFEKTEWNNIANKSIILGYETTVGLEITTENQKTIESVLTWLSKNEKVHPENLRMFTGPEKLKTAQEQCIEIAVINARKRAELLAHGDGARVGKMLSAQFSETSNTDNARPVLRMMKSENFSAAADTRLQTKDTEISVSVSAVFEIR